MEFCCIDQENNTKKVCDVNINHKQRSITKQDLDRETNIPAVRRYQESACRQNSKAKQ